MSTWPDGTPRSTGNAFDWRVEPTPLTPEQLRLKKQAAYEKEAYTRRRQNRAAHAKTCRSRGPRG